MEIIRLMPRFFEGLQVTLALWAVTLVLSLPLAFPVAFLRSSKNRIISTIDKGQWEAGQMLGITRPVLFFRVILPQTIRTVIPAVTNEVTTLVKDTSLVYILGLGDLLRQGKIYANNLTSLVPFLVVGVIYFVVITVISKGCEKIENAYSYF